MGDVTPDVEALARAFHEAYERLAPSFGYETRPESAVPWESVPLMNKRLMMAVVEGVLVARLKACEEARDEEALRARGRLAELTRAEAALSECRLVLTHYLRTYDEYHAEPNSFQRHRRDAALGALRTLRRALAATEKPGEVT